MSVRVSIEPAVLRWALGRTGYDEERLATIFPAAHAWLEGTGKPTLTQARNLAHRAHIPFGRLLMKHPTGDAISLPDFRTVGSASVTSADNLSPELIDVVKTCELRLEWYAEFASSSGIPGVTGLGSASLDQSPSRVAKRCRHAFQWDDHTPIPGSNKVSRLATAMEESGVLVARNSVVNNNTKRPLAVEEFRGFTITRDTYALVFVNTNDSSTAQLFSLAHELGHVLLGIQGISGTPSSFGDETHKRGNVETWCNAFAAEFLVPVSSLTQHAGGKDDELALISSWARRFGVSREVMLYRWHEAGLISREKVDAFRPLFTSPQSLQKANKRSAHDGGPAFSTLVRFRVGERFLHAISAAEASGELSSRDASRMLGITKASTFDTVIGLVRDYA